MPIGIGMRMAIGWIDANGVPIPPPVLGFLLWESPDNFLVINALGGKIIY
jgi:hypothetical protein